MNSTDNYDDIKHLTRPQYREYQPMSRHDRAAQFSPFSALVGYGDEVAETARFVDSRKELAEDDITELNSALNRLLDMLDEQPVVRVTYFVPDKKKTGGTYAEKTGVVRIYDEYDRSLVFFDGSRISVAYMSSVVFVDDEK